MDRCPSAVSSNFPTEDAMGMKSKSLRNYSQMLKFCFVSVIVTSSCELFLFDYRGHFKIVKTTSGMVLV
jgi:hypothetical protein